VFPSNQLEKMILVNLWLLPSLMSVSIVTPHQHTVAYLGETAGCQSVRRRFDDSLRNASRYLRCSRMSVRRFLCPRGAL
jgi:hypothetical protein